MVVVVVNLTWILYIISLGRSRVIGIGDYRGYRRLIAYIAVFDREGVVRCW